MPRKQPQTTCRITYKNATTSSANISTKSSKIPKQMPACDLSIRAGHANVPDSLVMKTTLWNTNAARSFGSYAKYCASLEVGKTISCRPIKKWAMPEHKL